MNAHSYELTKNHEGFVSIWVGIVPLAEIPEEYFMKRYDDGTEVDDDDEDLEPNFIDDFSVLYDEDRVDYNCCVEEFVSVERLIGECSHSTSYLKPACESAKKLGLETTQNVILLHDFNYALNPLHLKKNKYMHFIGSFPFDSDAEIAFQSGAK
ncbi:immunity 22 family protein [Anatilimnocola floriformis]|uniref:immunity 22 family protein n=1 Tax=Anatilimnocola floriformis TaxID=2948575 RepID=UPI0021BC8A34|nr:immunity 22 family protein [Anatilimnocola floriformis]